MGHSWFYRATATVVAKLEVQESKKAVMGGVSNGYTLVCVKSEKQMYFPKC